MSRKRVRKNQKNKFEGSTQSATHGESLRARQVALIVAKLPKERSLISCSRVRLRKLEIDQDARAITFVIVPHEKK